MIRADKVEALYDSTLAMLERARSKKRPLRRYLIVEWLVSFGLEGTVAVCDADAMEQGVCESFSLLCRRAAKVCYKSVQIGQFLKEFVAKRTCNSTSRMRELEIWIILGCLFRWPVSLLEDWSDQLAIEYSVCRNEETDRIPGGITADFVDSLKRHCALFDASSSAMDDWLFAVTSVLGLGDVYENSESNSESDSDCFDADQASSAMGNQFSHRRPSVMDLCDGFLSEDKEQQGNIRSIRSGGPLKNHVKSEVSTVVVSSNFVHGSAAATAMAARRPNQTKSTSMSVTRRKSVKKFFVLSTPPKPASSSVAASSDALPSSSISSLPSLERLSFDNL